jgi:putative acyl-CoA dehydrogenase
MGMTERQGGSDVRSNLTRAHEVQDGSARLRGHKWFFSAPQCDAHLTLAQGAAGLTCYLLPRFLPDGTRNAVRINRLKDKVGNRSNASAEVEFDEALAWPIGDPGRGIATILRMVQHTRLDCVLGTAGMMRAAVSRAFHHARQRIVFGQRLVDTPLMRNVLADLALESEAATALALRLARTFEAGAEPAERALARILTPAAKYWICKRGPALAAEAMEVLGGNGYVEDSALPRLYREMPVNSIWEGSGNVMCIDVVRAVRREPGASGALLDEFHAARGGHAAFDARLRDLEPMLTNASDDVGQGRQLAQLIVTMMQAALLLRHAPSAVAEAFSATRLGLAAFAGGAFGALPAAAASPAILERALPERR